MKRLYTLLLGLVMAAMSASAMYYDDAARQAYYLTDKMAYELDLTDYQYDRVYQINLDYFLRIETERDAYGYLWEYRNACLARVLHTKQYRRFNRAEYFFRPLRWLRGAWYLHVYDRYARDRWYRPAPPPAYRGPVYGHYYGHHGSTPPPPPHGGSAHKPGYDNHHPGGGYAPQPNHGGSRPQQGGQGRPGDTHQQPSHSQSTHQQPGRTPQSQSAHQQPSRSGSQSGGAARGGRR